MFIDIDRLMKMNVKAAQFVYRLSKAITMLMYLFLRDRISNKFAHLWIRSLLPGHTPLTDQVPWITFKAREWLESYLKLNMSVFEYGSGGSTIFLSKRVNRLISVEHDKGWYSCVSSVLSEEGISNCEYILCEPEKNISGETLFRGCRSYASKDKEYAGTSFEDYVKSIEKHPDESFDLVIVDGRARSSCLYHAISKIRLGGYLMLDNSERQEYNDAISLLADCRRRDFFGLGPRCLYLWQTSVWEIKSLDKYNK